MSGTLYVIGTPIGNLGDITLRQIETLEKIEVLFCEDSRVSSRLINNLMSKNLLTKKPRYVPYNEFNEDRIFPQIVEMVSQGQSVGLVSDAGMPAISDPGYRAIRACLDAKLDVQVIPGPTALTTALPWSGMGGEIATYIGFLPKTSGKAIRILEVSKEMIEKLGTGRLVLYVSPHRLVKDLAHIKEVMGGETHAVLMRELTKQFEERVEASVDELLEKYTKTKVKGELVLILSK
ncbi:16S rRNA (cytidine(1402)-2'-O)-methyltransferase [Candidatus Woesebacteria bacterium]|nr:16S rRNA (cytidine(1402)-2'-O)-methyltransferase [Candidatus Woesebacteria bacterium]